MMTTSFRQCQGCNLTFPYQKDLEHYQNAGIGKYGVASPECLAAYFDILAKENELYGYPPAHRLIVDAYSVQHPRNIEIQKQFKIEPRLVKASVQSIAMHLIALYCAVELKMPLSTISQVMDAILSNMTKQGVEFDELAAPDNFGSIKVIDVKNKFFEKNFTLDEYNQLAWNWANSAWNAWKNHHQKIKEWYEAYR